MKRTKRWQDSCNGQLQLHCHTTRNLKTSDEQEEFQKMWTYEQPDNQGKDWSMWSKSISAYSADQNKVKLLFTKSILTEG